MSENAPLWLFVAGVVIGVAIVPIGSFLFQSGRGGIFDAIGRLIIAPFRFLSRLYPKEMHHSVTADFSTEKERNASREETEESPDAEELYDREQKLSDAAEKIRQILQTLAAAIHRAEQAAADSSGILEEVHAAIERMQLPAELSDVNMQLLREIDRVVSSNRSLRRELAASQDALEDQRQQIEALKIAVRIDSLTRLANRPAFDEKLREQLSLFDRYGDTFSLMMIDVDLFKLINDTHGHQGGDRILKGVAFKIRNVLRESDFVARYGGDEFAVIVMRATAEVARDIAWKLCNEVRESRFLLDGVEVKTTLSIGVAEARQNESAEELMRRADRALYKVKQIGRNGVVLADQEG